MSANLETLQRQIAGGEDLSSIVRTMKALAATSVRQYEKAAESLDDYFHTVELGLSVVLATYTEHQSGKRADKDVPVLLLVFGSDHGLAGRFNEQIVSFVLEDYWSASARQDGAGEMGEGAPVSTPEQETHSGGHASNTLKQEGSKMPPRRIVFGIGEQATGRLDAAGVEPDASFTMPTSISAITPFIQLLLEKIEQRRSQNGVGKVLLFYNRPLTGTFSPRAETLLPVDLAGLRETRLAWQSRSLPTYTMPAAQLLSALLRQYFFVSLYRACALSLAAENTSRLAAMQAAEKNIDERLAMLRTAYQQERQAAITEELLDIISGFKAVKGKKLEAEEFR